MEVEGILRKLSKSDIDVKYFFLETAVTSQHHNVHLTTLIQYNFFEDCEAKTGVKCIFYRLYSVIK